MQKTNLRKISLSWWIIVFGKTMENVRNHRDIKLITSDKRRKRLVSKPNYHSHKKFSDHLMAIEMKKNKSKND